MARKYKQQAPTTFSFDSAGNRLAHVALAGTDLRATLLAEDLERLLAAGLSPHWSFAGSNGEARYIVVYVCGPQGRKRATTIARLIAGAGKGQVVTYADGDRLNLRRDNLLVRSGAAWTPLEDLQIKKGVLATPLESTEQRQAPRMFTTNFRGGIGLSGSA